MAIVDIWTYREEPWMGLDIGGFSIEARDGKIGKVTEVTTDLDARALVVDTGGGWPGGKDVLLPAGVVDAIDIYDRKVHADLTKDEIKNAPAFDRDRYRDSVWREKLGSYYTTKHSRSS